MCAFVNMCLVVTCWERADLLALVCGAWLWVCHFPTSILGQVYMYILHCIDSWSLHPHLFSRIPDARTRLRDSLNRNSKGTCNPVLLELLVRIIMLCELIRINYESDYSEKHFYLYLPYWVECTLLWSSSFQILPNSDRLCLQERCHIWPSAWYWDISEAANYLGQLYWHTSKTPWCQWRSLAGRSRPLHPFSKLELLLKERTCSQRDRILFLLLMI